MTDYIITKDYEYYNEVYYQWLPVPTHWIGLTVKEVSHAVRVKTTQM